MAELEDLTDKFRLGYFPVYEKMAAEIGPKGNVLEVGVAEGGSLSMWQYLFPEGKIVGADNCAFPGVYNYMWPVGSMFIISDQNAPFLREKATELVPEGYDLIVDDASHKGELSEETFKLLWPLVKPGGWYVLEDWTVGIIKAVGWKHWGDSMLKLAQSFITMLGPAKTTTDQPHPVGEVDRVEYTFGMAMVHKRVKN